MVKIVTDSTSYLTEQDKSRYDISVISLNVIIDGKSYREVDLDNHHFYIQMSQAKEIPSSSQPSLQELVEVFENIVKSGDCAVGIFLSSDMSGTFSSAHLAKNMVLEKYPEAKIELIDSRTNSMEMGFAVLEAARAAKEGKSLPEVLTAAHHVMQNSRYLFTPKTLDYLKKGGRIGGAAALLGTFLQIKPILTVEDGKANVFCKVRTQKKALETIVSTFIEDIKPDRLGEAVIHHIDCKEEAYDLARYIKENYQLDLPIQDIGPVIGLHVGPGTLGIAYYKK